MSESLLYAELNFSLLLLLLLFGRWSTKVYLSEIPHFEEMKIERFSVPGCHK